MSPQPKRSLGQNFLTNPAIAGKIADAAHLTRSDTVLEIGPGRGILTTQLLARADRVVAIEKDDELAAELAQQFRDAIVTGSLTLVHDDALHVTPEALGLHDRSYKLVANIPYNITGLLIRKYLSAHIQPNTMVLLVQKEVAERIVARDGKESILSLSVKAYGQPSIEGIVKAGSFTPAPKVDSAILAVKTISRAHFADADHEARFFAYVKAGFAQKRKQLAGNLARAELSLTEAQRALIETATRAEDLTLAQWIELSRV